MSLARSFLIEPSGLSDYRGAGTSQSRPQTCHYPTWRSTPRMRTKRMALGLILIFVGLGAAFLGARSWRVDSGSTNKNRNSRGCSSICRDSADDRLGELVELPRAFVDQYHDLTSLLANPRPLASPTRSGTRTVLYSAPRGKGP
jgi:hypothetical protein